MHGVKDKTTEQHSILHEENNTVLGELQTGHLHDHPSTLSQPSSPPKMLSVLSTWTFSKPGAIRATSALKNASTALQAAELGIQTVELDPTVTSAGYGGLPNAAGVLQLDAAIMTNTGQAGAVMAVESFPSAIPLATLVLHRSVHTALAGDGVLQFAVRHGLHPRNDPSTLLTSHAKARYDQFRNGLPDMQPHQTRPEEMPHTDTVGLIARDETGKIAVGCATSGMQFKACGRVGDSPIIGAGLFADAAGAAVASGDGDTMMRFCIAFLVVEGMRAGYSPHAACHAAMQRVYQAVPGCQAAVCAMAADGSVGAASTHRGFDVMHWNSGMAGEEPEVIQAGFASNAVWKHSCV